MAQEDKELLLKDLCERVSYNLRFKIGDYSDYKLIGIVITDEHPIKVEVIENGIPYKVEVSVASVKPYLRSMSSMTKEELYEIQEILGKGVEIRDVFITIVDSSIDTFTYLELQAVFDWLNKNMFDYRGLLERGLAIEAPKDMYNIKEK